MPALSVIPAELAMPKCGTRGTGNRVLESVGKHAKAQMRVSDVHTAIDLGQHFPAPPEPNSQNDIHLRLAIAKNVLTFLIFPAVQLHH